MPILPTESRVMAGDISSKLMLAADDDATITTRVATATTATEPYFLTYVIYINSMLNFIISVWHRPNVFLSTSALPPLEARRRNRKDSDNTMRTETSIKANRHFPWCQWHHATFVNKTNITISLVQWNVRFLRSFLFLHRPILRT